MSRKPFQRLTEADRRRGLLDATLDCIGAHGLSGASARRIALHAGVTAGLIRHHFGTMEELVRCAYRHLMDQLTGEALLASQAGRANPEQALAQFIAANVMGPNISAQKVALWATFIGRVGRAPGYSEIHRDSYRDFLELLERLIHPVRAAYALPADPDTCRDLSIALNGLIDGLWLEGSLGHGLYHADRLPRVALSAAEGVLRLPDHSLLQHLPDGPMAQN